MKAPAKFAQWTISAAIFGILFIAVLIMANENDSSNSMPLGKRILVQAGAVAIIYACYRCGRFLQSHGLLASIDNEDTTEEEDYYE